MKFSAQKPTVPGAYWWKATPTANRIVIEIISCDGGLYIDAGDGVTIDVPDGLWSSRLVPVCEVEEAYREGERHGSVDLGNYYTSRARRVVEGKEKA